MTPRMDTPYITAHNIEKKQDQKQVFVKISTLLPCIL